MASDAPGAFVYRPGDTITMKIGNVTLAEFDADSIQGDVLFLQDIAGVALSDVNNDYVENMAIFLQLLDEDGDPTNGIQISDATHEALADYVDPTTGEPLNMATADKQMLSDVLGHLGISFTAQSETDPDPSDGSQNVFETQAMTHVADTITEQGGERAPNTFDDRLEDSIVVPGGVIDFNYNSDVGDNGTITFTRDDLLKGAVPQQVNYDNLIVSDVAISDGFEAIGTLSYNSDTQTYTIDLAEGVTREQIAGLTVDYKVQDWTVITEAVATTLDESQLTGADDAESGIEDTTIEGSVANDVTTSGGVLTFALTSDVLAAENSDGSIDLPNGTLTVAADFATTGNYAFVPNQDFNGAETFTYTVTDSESGERATQTVTLTVTPALEENEITITAISDDSGASSTDFLTNDTELTVQGTLANALASDEQLQISVDGDDT